MSQGVREVNGKFLCTQHNESVLGVLLNKDSSEDMMFACQICIRQFKGSRILMNVNDAIAIVYEMISQQGPTTEDLKFTLKYNLKLLSEEVEKIKNDFNINISSLEELIMFLQNDIDKPFSQNSIQTLITGMRQLKDKEKVYKDFAEFINQKSGSIQKMDTIFQKLFNENIGLKFQELFKNMMEFIFDLQGNLKVSNVNKEDNIQFKEMVQQDIQQKHSQLVSQQLMQQKIPNYCQVDLVNQVSQAEWAIAQKFNQDGTSMITGKSNDLQIWDFADGKLTKKEILKGHDKGWVYCLEESKKSDWIISGGQDKSIRCYKKEINNDWSCSPPFIEHTNYVMDIKLIDNEKELISCSWDNTIISWETNFQHNQLQKKYLFDQKHTGSVYCISLNEDESLLVSCGNDHKIILWKRNRQRQWKYLSELNYDHYGKKISFIRNDIMIWQQTNKGITHIIQVIDEKLVKKGLLNLDNEIDDHQQFPIIVNKQKQIIIQNHHRYIYIFRYLPQEGLKLIADPIDCMASSNYGTLSPDGQYLVVWASNQFNIYKLQIKY